MTVGSLFAGIGGFDLGLERAGMTVKWQVEIDPFCRRVLAKHWPHVRRYGDVRAIHAAGVCGHPEVCDRCVEPVDVLCGGFPCQDISVAGRGEGIDGARSGLWSEYARLIREVRPRYVVVENVSALLARGLGRVLGDLAACGYDAEWDCLPASAFGAPHRRDRLWLIAYTGREQTRQPQRELRRRVSSVLADDGQKWNVADAASRVLFGTPQGQAGHVALGGQNMADANSSGRIEQRRAFPIRAELPPAECRRWWESEPAVGRVAHGIPQRVDRLRGLGNAVVPQIPEWIGRQILEYERQQCGRRTA